MTTGILEVALVLEIAFVESLQSPMVEELSDSGQHELQHLDSKVHKLR